MGNSYAEDVAKIKKLKSEIIYRRDLCAPIKPSGDVVSAWDIFKAINKRFGECNRAFFGNYYGKIRNMNFRNGFIFEHLPSIHKGTKRIGDIGFYVDENGYYFCRVYFVNQFDDVIEEEVVDNFVKVNGCSLEVNNNKKTFIKYLDALEKFVEENHYSPETPGIAYRWDSTNPIVKPFTMGDDFIESYFDIYNPDHSRTYLTKRGDRDTAKADITDDSELEDIVYGCSISMLQSTPVNLNDIANPTSDNYQPAADFISDSPVRGDFAIHKIDDDTNNMSYIPFEIMLDITIDFVNKICNKIEEILDLDINIDSILYVGGYFSSKVVFYLVKKKLIKIINNKGLNKIKHILIKEPNLAVVKGATLFGLNPDLISSRKSDITLGIKCLKNGKFFFDKFINVGDDIYPEKEEKHSFKMHGNQFAVFELIKCNIKNPSPYDESLFTHHCTLTPLDIGMGHREGETIELRMKIGTFINCFGYYENEEKINVKVDFMNNISHNESNDFDILYMIDGTGSMGSYIEAAKKKCIEISEELNKTYANKLNFKYGVIFYRDPIDEKNDRHEKYPLDNIINVRREIESVKAYGGGDDPEDWVGAFKIALDDTNIIRWRNGIKLIIHIADAPAHGDEFAGKKNYTEEGPKLIEQIKECVRQEIKIFGLFIGKSAENSFKKFKEYYDSYDRENKGLYKVENFNEGEGKDIAEKFKFLVLQAVHTIEPLDN